MTGKLALATIVLAAVSLVLLICTRPHQPADQTGRSARRPAAPRVSRLLPSSTTRPSSSPPATVTAVYAQRLLPFTPAQIAAATQRAVHFAAAYASYRYDEPPRAYLARLAPIISAQLRPSIDRAAADPAVLDHRYRQHEIAIATAHPDAIRTLGPSSITVIVTTTTRIAGDHAARTETVRYAVTTIRHGDGWLIYAIELATTGEVGGVDGDGP